MRTYVCRGKVSKFGHRRLDTVLSMCAELYNACLQSKLDCQNKTGRVPTYFEQTKEITHLRKDIPEFGEIAVVVLRGVAHRVNRAYFMRGNKRPRFKPVSRYRTIEIDNTCKTLLKRVGKKIVLSIKGLPKIEVKPTRELPDTSLLKRISITRKALRLQVALTYDVSPERINPSKIVFNPVGLDLGINKRVTFSDGRFVAKRDIKQEHKRLRRLKRALDRKQLGSNNRRKAELMFRKELERSKVKERNYLHRLTAQVIKEYDFISVERLDVSGLLKKSRFFTTDMKAQNWAKFLALLKDKAERAGVQFVKVSAKNTSQECFNCGTLVKKDLSVRKHVCGKCGYEVDRDVNAAKNILHRGLVSSFTGGSLLLSPVWSAKCMNTSGIPVPFGQKSYNDCII